MKFPSNFGKLLFGGVILLFLILGYIEDLSESIRLKTIHQNIVIIILFPIVFILFIVMIVRWTRAEKHQ